MITVTVGLLLWNGWDKHHPRHDEGEPLMTNYLHPRPGEYVDAARAADIEDEARRDAVDAAADDRDDQAEPLDTGQIKPDDLYQQAIEEFEDFGPIDERIRAVVDLVLAARPDRPERQPWDVLREAATILDSSCLVHAGGWCPSADGSRRVADRLEAEHHAAQEKADAEAAREKLIEQAAQTIAYAMEPNDKQVPVGDLWLVYLTVDSRNRYRREAEALAAAGLLATPETTDGGAA